MNTVKKLFELIPERAEWIDGQTVYKALPGGRHARVELSIASGIRVLFDKKKKEDGRGGWWILTEVSVQYRKISELGRILTADIAGWRREETPICPWEYPVEVRPNWVCEVCHTTRKKDTTIVPETLAAEGVEWYWFVDVEDELLTVFHLENNRYTLLKTWTREDGKACIPPFDAVALSLPVLFGDDADE